MESRATKSLHLLLCRCLSRDIITVPSEFEIAVRSDEHVEELHDQLVIVALQKLSNDAQDLLGKVLAGENLVARKLGVH
jgi:hypothetical protein